MRPQIFSQFSNDLFFSFSLVILTLQQIHLYGAVSAPLPTQLSHMALHLHRQIKPFTANRAPSGPFQGPYPEMGPFYPRLPLGREVRGDLRRLRVNHVQR